MPGWTGRLLLLGLAVGLVAGAGERAPGVERFRAAFEIHIGGIWAGELKLAARLGPADYRAEASLRTTGIVGFFVDESWSARTEGRLAPGGLVPVRYAANQRRAEDRTAREVAFADGDPVSVTAEPALEPKPWSIAVGDQPGTTDPVTALVSMLAPAPEGAACGRVIEVYDGRHRFAFDIAGAEPAGEGLRCDAVYVRRAGYKPEKMGENARRPFTLYLEARDDGLFRVARIETGTEFGMAVMVPRE